VRAAASSGESLMAILNDVLDHSKIEAGKLALAPTPVSLHGLATSVISLFRANASDKGLSLQLKIEDDVADWVVVDGQRLKQVLLNLVSNAIKFTDRGTVRLQLRSVLAAPGHTGVLVEVHDTGIGIASRAAKDLFLPFTQLDT